MVKKILSIFIMLTITFINIPSTVSVAEEALSSSAGSVVLNIPDTKFDIRKDITFGATIVGDFTGANVIYNGEVVDTFAQSSGESYEITIGADVEKHIGTNTVYLEVRFADGSKNTASGVFNAYSPIDISLIKTDMTKVPSDFPVTGSSSNAHAESLWHSLTGMSCKYDEPRGAKLYTIKSFSNGTTEYTGDFFKVAKESGTSAELNLQTDTFETMDSGIIRVIYDVFVTGNITRTRFNFMGFKKDGTTSGSKYYDMNNLVNNKWNKLTLDFDLSNDKIYYTREAEGETTYTNNVGVSSSDIDKVNRFRLLLLTDSSVSDQAYIFKNISVQHLTGKENSLSLTSYNLPDSAQTPVADSKVHADAQKLLLTASDTISNVSSLEIVSETGEKIEGVTFSLNDKNVEVILPDGGVPTGNFKIVLDKNAKLAGREVSGKLSSDIIFYQDTKAATSAGLMVGDTALGSPQQITIGSVIKANVVAKNNKNEETNLVYVLTVRDGSRLVSMNAKSVTLPPLNEQPGYEESFILQLPAITKPGNYKVYLIAIDSYSNSIAADDCLGIE